MLQLARWVHASGGGVRSYLASIAAALSGSDVSLQAASVEPSVPPDYLPDVPHTGRLGAPGSVNALAFWRWVRGGVRQADVIHIHGVFGWVFVLGGIACVLAGKPYVVSPHGSFLPWYMSRKRFKKYLFLKLIALPLLRRASAVVATSPSDIEEIRAVDASLNIVFIMPGVMVPPQPSVRFLVEPRPPNQLQILYLGRLDVVKDVPTLLHAVYRIRQRGIDAQLQIVGWGTPEATVEAETVTRRLQLEPHVRFRGYLDGVHKRDVLEAADVMAIPSHSENFSFATAEALAVGLPVVVTSGVALSRLVRENGCGQVVPPGDVEAFAAALVSCTDIVYRRDVALRAHTTAQRELSLSAMRVLLQSVYRAALADRGPAR